MISTGPPPSILETTFMSKQLSRVTQCTPQTVACFSYSGFGSDKLGSGSWLVLPGHSKDFEVHFVLQWRIGSDSYPSQFRMDYRTSVEQFKALFVDVDGFFEMTKQELPNQRNGQENVASRRPEDPCYYNFGLTCQTMLSADRHR